MDIQRLRQLDDFINENYEESAGYGAMRPTVCEAPEQAYHSRPAATKHIEFRENIVYSISDECEFATSDSCIPDIDVETKTFAETLFDYIDSRNITDGEAANRSGVDRRVMSKIRTNPKYTPTKKTIFSFAVGLRLTEEETIELLMKAGYAFTNTSKLDLVLQYFIREKNYNIWEINEALDYYGQEPVCC